MDKIKIACPCLFGFESLIADEIKQLGYENIVTTNGRVVFTADEAAVARANINLRCAERVLILLSEFEAKTFEELFQGIKNIPWERWIGKNDCFPVKGWSLDSTLFSVSDCQAITKKAIVERLKSKYNIEWFQETGAKIQIQFSILKDSVSVYLDTTGDGLHKRGYRANANEAPLKETFAAAMVKLSRYNRFKTLYDPFCGSGTILIEAALYGMNIAPGINRKFSAESWSCLDKGIWAAARSEALDKVKRMPLEIYGYDIDPKAIELTFENAKKAGVGDSIKAKVQEIRDFAPTQEKGIVVCNPPYGERMLEQTAAEEIYRQMGKAMLKLHGWNFYVLSSSENFEACFGKKADKKRKLYNGMIKCDLFQYFK